MIRFTLPLALFAGLAVLLWRGLSLDPTELPSTLIDKPAPGFVLSRLHQPEENISPDDMAGKVWMLNVWASWCVACRQEHPVVTSLSRQVDIVGLNYKDNREDALRWLDRWGNPYLASAFDNAGDAGIDYGVYGVPETFIIDQQGHIRYKHVGPISSEQARQTLLPIVEDLKKSIN